MGFFKELKDGFNQIKIAMEVNDYFHPTYSYAKKQMMPRNNEMSWDWAYRVREFLREALANESDPEVFYERRYYIAVLWYTLQTIYQIEFRTNTEYTELWKECVRMADYEDLILNETMFKIFVLHRVPITQILGITGQKIDTDQVYLLFKMYFDVGYSILDDFVDNIHMTEHPVSMFNVDKI